MFIWYLKDTAMAKNEKKKILLVDDDELHLTVAESILKDEYDIIIAKSGKEAIAYFIQRRFPNMVLLDVLMPDMDGWETYKRLKALSFLQNIPIVFLTSLNQINDAYDMGAADLITKPYKKEDLLERISEIFKKNEEKN
jgi:CheY-like chemotaxis protein